MLIPSHFHLTSALPSAHQPPATEEDTQSALKWFLFPPRCHSSSPVYWSKLTIIVHHLSCCILTAHCSNLIGLLISLTCMHISNERTGRHSTNYGTLTLAEPRLSQYITTVLLKAHYTCGEMMRVSVIRFRDVVCFALSWISSCTSSICNKRMDQRTNYS